MEQNLKLDSKKFLLESLRDIKRAKDFAYPNDYLDTTRAHGALCKVGASVEILINFVESLESE